MNIHDRQWCRLCDGRMQSVFSLSPTPIANNYAEKPDQNARKYPLELSQCTRCAHVQQRYVLDGLFEDYKYVTPRTVETYLKPMAKQLKEKYPKAKLVLEIGSNNGVFLDCLSEAGFQAVGIDPASTHPLGIKRYFSFAESMNFKARFDIIVANNVLAHIDDLKDVFKGMERLLSADGVIVFEVQYFPALVDSGAFDMIYHEHMSYHTLAPLARFLRSVGLVMTEHEFIPTHGGSIRVTAQKNGSACVVNERKIDWGLFRNKVEEVRKSVRDLTEGRKVVLLGAAAKVTTMIHHCGIADRILFACDDTPQKQFRYIPGTGIQIRPTTELGEHPALLGAWNYEKEWRQKFPNNEFINPFP